MHRLTIFVVLVTSCLAATAEDKLPGFDSPEQAFRAYIKGAVTQDHDLQLSSLTREAKAYHLALATFSAVYLFIEDPAMQGIFHEHGLDVAPRNASAKDEPDEDVGDKALVEAMSKIEKPGKFMKKIADRTEALAKMLAESAPESDKPRATAKRPTNEQIMASITLGKVKVAGDSAIASLTLTAPAKDVWTTCPDRIKFRRVDKRWYCDIDPR